jgi:thioredoxin reductase
MAQEIYDTIIIGGGPAGEAAAVSAGDGVRAALSAYNYLQKIKKHSPCEEGDIDETI